MIRCVIWEAFCGWAGVREKDRRRALGELDYTQLAAAVVKGNANAARSLVQNLVQAGGTVDRIIEEGLLPGLKTVGDKYEAGEFFLPELFAAGEVAKEVLCQLEPYVQAGMGVNKGTIVIGTVHGDVHDIGMNLVAATLEGAGYNVVNLGSKVSADRFVDAAQRHTADVVAMSALLTTTMTYMGVVLDALKESGIRERIRVLVGGAPLDDAYARQVEADAYGKDARDALRIVETFMSGE